MPLLCNVSFFVGLLRTEREERESEGGLDEEVVVVVKEERERVFVVVVTSVASISAYLFACFFPCLCVMGCTVICCVG